MYTLLYQRPLLRLYECNVNIIHSNEICESKQGFEKMAEMLTLTFLLYKYIVFVFLLFKVHIILL